MREEVGCRFSDSLSSPRATLCPVQLRRGSWLSTQALRTSFKTIDTILHGIIANIFFAEMKTSIDTR
eukprot:scaffold12996_cov79-Skeletonema_dohrnii-CCMP3373.AAC.1